MSDLEEPRAKARFVRMQSAIARSCRSDVEAPETDQVFFKVPKVIER